MAAQISRLDEIRAHLNDAAPAAWSEPFHRAWMSGLGLDERVRLSQAQAAEMAAARPAKRNREKAYADVDASVTPSSVTDSDTMREFRSQSRKGFSNSIVR